MNPRNMNDFCKLSPQDPIENTIQDSDFSIWPSPYVQFKSVQQVIDGLTRLIQGFTIIETELNKAITKEADTISKNTNMSKEEAEKLLREEVEKLSREDIKKQINLIIRCTEGGTSVNRHYRNINLKFKSKVWEENISGILEYLNYWLQFLKSYNFNDIYNKNTANCFKLKLINDHCKCIAEEEKKNTNISSQDTPVIYNYTEMNPRNMNDFCKLSQELNIIDKAYIWDNTIPGKNYLKKTQDYSWGEFADL